MSILTLESQKQPYWKKIFVILIRGLCSQSTNKATFAKKNLSLDVELRYFAHHSQHKLFCVNHAKHPVNLDMI